MKYVLSASIALLVLMVTLGAIAGRSSGLGAVESSAMVIEESGAQGTQGRQSAATRVYEIDPTHTNVIFKIRHNSVANFYGRFNTTQGTINLDKDNFERSSMEITVQMSSIDTHNRTRDGHLKGADFFNVRQYHQAKFVSSGIEEVGDGVYRMTGDFTLQGKTVPIEVQVVDVHAKVFNDFDMLGVEARFTIKRSDFGITKHLDANDPENGPLGDRVDIIVGIEAVGK